MESLSLFLYHKIVMQVLENLITAFFKRKILFWHHYLEDIFILIDKRYLKNILNHATLTASL